MKRFLPVRAIFALLAGLLAAVPAVAETTVIRFGYPGVGADNRPFSYGGITGAAHAGGFLERAFANDPDVKLEWTFFRGAGPALNESLAAGQLDFAIGLGDLPSIVHRANGLKTKWIATEKVRDTIYLAVRPNTGITRIEDLKGRKISQFKGTNLQLAADRVLAAHGLTERNVRFLNLDFGNAIAALTSGDVDGSFGGVELFELRRRGVVDIAYTTKGDDPTFGRNAALFVTEAFERAHPDLVQRVVTAFVRAAHYAADEANREAVIALWTKSGHPAESFRADFENEPLARRLTPLLDEYVLARYRDQAARAREYNLIRKDADIDGWVERKYLDRALVELGLKSYWPQYDAAGHKVTTGEVERTRAAAQ
ncbi:Alkanesulfonates-binding protein [Rhodovastum atsumiense]|uniref:ABC transporter substrate-binding protein n=1 Tax=Rhodovastum atsumiense TaxID=504468 RepID=UPI00193C6897|nr:ABC transporter substrate-binding protein [Rhodovastum atsumiense]CAH2601287.1 Alkanesulfonates-binding protein [Rhodovastum atsumiense]